MFFKEKNKEKPENEGSKVTVHKVSSPDKGCCGSVDAETVKTAEKARTEGAAVKILGSGCDKCNQLEKATKEALSELGMDTEIDHVHDFSLIASYGVMTTPALVVDGKVVSYGKVLKKDEIIKILKSIR
jgi:small redox-active disulfide protein 2